jgi:hypothetical protein
MFHVFPSVIGAFKARFIAATWDTAAFLQYGDQSGQATSDFLQVCVESLLPRIMG